MPTGYIGNYAILEKIEFMVQKLKSKNPSLIYGKYIYIYIEKELLIVIYMYIVCDTVMGDGGALYVAPEIVPLYRDILRIADFITPNQFEAE